MFSSAMASAATLISVAKTVAFGQALDRLDHLAVHEAEIAHVGGQWRVGNAVVQAVHLKSLIKAVVDQLKENPFALLCQRQDCERHEGQTRH